MACGVVCRLLYSLPFYEYIVVKKPLNFGSKAFFVRKIIFNICAFMQHSLVLGLAVVLSVAARAVDFVVCANRGKMENHRNCYKRKDL